MSQKNSVIQFSSLFRPSQVICQTEYTDRDTILMELLRLLTLEKTVGDVQQIYRTILERENEHPTVVGPGIAMPHARLEDINEIVVGVATSKNGIVYASNVDNPIKLIILTLAPKASPAAYLQAMSSLAKICQDPATADIVARLPTAQKVWSFFDTGGMVLPDYLRARDLMEPIKVKLQEHDTLEQAINLFVTYGLRDLPVVDKEENLVGVVTTYELLRVCLPDYILWMEDLTPILNFETFKEILHKESKTWLAEIMTTEYATIGADAPAIQAAKEIIRRQADRAYVVQGQKLVGVISLVTFLSRVLRE
jgi:PTS system nitrogen regulatory IIA component